MGTKLPSQISAALFGKTRRALLGIFFGDSERELYHAELSRLTNSGHGALQRELRNLLSAGIIVKSARGNQHYYRANPECPVYWELKQFIAKTEGAADRIQRALAPLRDRIHSAFIFGSAARGDLGRGSDVDLMVVGEASFGDVVDNLAAAQRGLGREINPSVYTNSEFISKFRAGHPFLKHVVEGPKVFVLGDEVEFGDLAG